MSSSEQQTNSPATPSGGESSCSSQRSSSMTQTHPHGRARRRHMKRTRSAPDCKHGISSKIKIGVCAMDKKAQSKPMCEILARLTAGAEFEVVPFGDKVILDEPVESWPLCDVLLSWHSEGFPLRKAQAYVELRRPFLINDVHSQDLLLDRRRVYKTLVEHNIPVPRHILVNREPAPAVIEPSDDIDELTTSSGSAGSSPRAGSSRSNKNSNDKAPTSAAAAAAAAAPKRKDTPPASVDDSPAAGSTAPAATAPDGAEVAEASAAAVGPESLLDPPGFVEEEDYVELSGVRIYKPFVEKPVSGEDHNINIYYPTSMGGGVKRLFRKVDNKSADYDPHHPGTVRRDGSYIYEEFLTTGGTDVKVYTVGPRYAHAEARKSPVVDGKVNRTPDGKEVRFPVLLSPQEKEIARMVCLAFGQRVCGFDLLRSETGRSFVCDVNGWSFVKNSKKYYDDAAGILRVMVLSQLAPHRLTVAPEAPMPLAGLLEEAASAAHAAGDGAPPSHQSSATEADVLAATGLSFIQEPSISAAAAPAELGWEEQPSGLGVDVEQEEVTGLKEVSSLQDLTSLDGAYEEEGMGTDDSSSTVGAAANDTSRHLELRCVLAVIRHGDRTPKQKMKVTVTQEPLLELFNKYKDSKGKQAKLKSPGQLQELLDIVRALLADMEAKSSSRSARTSSAAAGAPPTEEEKAQEQKEELREKLRIVRTVLEQGGTFSGINRKVQLKPTKWSNPTPAPTTTKPDTPEQQQQPQGTASEQPQQQAAAGSHNQSTKAAADGTRSARSSSTGGSVSAGAAGPAEVAKPRVTELLLILKYGGTLTHAGRAQAEELGKTFRMVMYPRYGPAGGGGFLRLHSTYRHDLKIYSSDEGRVQMSAAAFTKGLLDLEGSSLTPILVSLVTKNASMLDAFGKGASDDILNAKNTLYQHLTWDPDKTMSLCSKLALPLATPAVGVTPPVSPKSTSAEEALSPFHSSHSRGSQLEAGGSGSLPPVSVPNSGLSTPTASHLFGTSSEALPTTTSCMDMLHQGRPGASRRTRASTAGSGSGEPSQQQGSGTPRGGGSAGSLVAAATANAAGLGVPGFSKLTHSASWSAVRSAEARAAALSSIKAMPEKPLLLLYQLVDLMKVLVDQLREKCLEERIDTPPSTASNSKDSKDSKQDAGDKAGPAPAAATAAQSGDKPAAGAGAAVAGPQTTAAAGGSSGQSLQQSSSSRGSAGYSSSANAPDDWRLDANKPCSGERLLLMFDRWRKLLKSFYNEKKQQFDISKVPDIYDSAKYDAIHNHHLNLSSLDELYQVSRQLAAVVVPHEYGLDGPGKLLIGSKICAELLGKLMCDLDSMKEESIITAAIEEKTAAARAEEAKAAASSSRHARPRASSHASLLDGTFDAFDTEFGHMSVLDGRMRPPKAPGRSTLPGTDWAGGRRTVSGSGSAEGQNQQQQQQQQQQQDGQQDGQQQPEEAEEEEDRAEQETLHRLCPTYASDVNSPLRHVRTRIYFTSESHIHSLVNVLRYCHLACPSSSGAAAAAAASISKAPSSSNVAATGVAAGAAAAATTGAAGAAGSTAVAAAAAAVQQGPGGTTAAAAAAAAATTSGGGDAAATEAVAAAAAAAGTSDSKAAAATARGSSGGKGSVFAGAPGLQVAVDVAAAGDAVSADGSSAGEAVLQAVSSVASSTAGQQQQQLLTPQGQELLSNTDEFDYLTHIVFRMYENKVAPVDSPERFFVEIQFSNGANFDPTKVQANRHTLPTQNRRQLTAFPGVTLQTFQELTGKFARGKNSPSNYQLQVALRAPLSQASTLSKAATPVPGMSRAGSTNLGQGLAPTPPLPPVPPAAVTQLLVAGPGAAPSAPLPLSQSFVRAAAAAVETEKLGN